MNDSQTELAIDIPKNSQLRKIERDENGLIKGFNYIFDEFGFVSWRKSLPKEYIYLNPDKAKKEKIEKKYGKPFEEIDVVNDEVDDCDLVLSLSATRFLLRTRGFHTLETKVNVSTDTYASVTAIVKFIGNYETEGREITYSDSACAHLQNTTSFTKSYLVEMATNRAVIRCVRAFLGINSVSAAEIQGGNPVEESPINSPLSNGTAQGTLEKKCREKKIDLEKLKIAASIYQNELGSQVDGWEKWSDIPPKDCYLLLDKIHKKESSEKVTR